MIENDGQEVKMGMAVARKYTSGEKRGKLYGQRRESAIFIENDLQMCRSDIHIG